MKDNKTRELLISGYGPGNGQETSIALYEMTNQLEFNKVLWEDTVTAPSFLCTYHDICFGITEEWGSGAVLCYQRQDEKYILRDVLNLEGGALCHISYQPANQVLYASFYETGHVAAVKVDNYHFTKVLNFFQIQPDNAGELTRAHCSVLEPDGSRIFITNIALDRIYIYDSVDGTLKPNTSCQYVQLDKGIGPRHMKFHPLLNYLYLITEYSNEIYTFLYEKDNGNPRFTMLQKISTLPFGFTGESSGSGLDISKDGRFLYAANRGADTIAVYDINTDGTLNKIQDADCCGKCPRHIALTKDDTGLIIANQESNEVVILGVDEYNGMLSDIMARKSFYAPAYIEEL
ncbi:lactonase family protein [Anaerocolumna sp. MB42-C2]|uniref:lactonase family protein n=1 Tax=Anaerocolumna sp. MB42-C2 TaxID=3070997 RepID=UPI0027E1445A|nr:beta-propeller fold lactonase family protein [Anaerocolumna sp. MB42-C2]WMJ86407.1 beta-propeller fold lactonase family protein [Anaerocolumna sp. MB42-C2]